MSAATQAGSPAGSYQRWLLAVGLALLPFVLVVLVMTSQFRGLQVQAAYEQAATARRLATGEGFTTSILTPRSLVYNPSLTAHPELRQGPLSVWPTALLMKFSGEREGKTPAFSSMLAWLLAAWLLYAVARAIFGPRVGTVALLLMVFSPTSLQLAISGDGRAWVMPFLLGLWLTLALPRPGWVRPAAVGGLVALVALVAWQWLLPLLLAVLPTLLFPPAGPAPTARRGGLAVGLALVACIIVLAPWMIRNQRVAGTPAPALGTWSLLAFTKAVPGRSIERRYLDPGASVSGFAVHHQRELTDKVVTGLYSLRGTLSRALDWLLLALFVASLFQPLDGLRGRARSALVWGLLWHVLLLALGSQEFRVLAVWTPLLALYGAWFVSDRLAALYSTERRRWFLRQSPDSQSRWAVAGLLLVLAVPGLAPQVFGAKGPTASVSAPNLRILAEQLEPTDVLMTDDPWRVAWELNRPAIWLAQSEADLAAIEQLGRIDAIYFTSALQTGLFTAAERGDWWSWAQRMPQGYATYQVLETRVPGERILLNAAP